MSYIVQFIIEFKNACFLLWFMGPAIDDSEAVKNARPLQAYSSRIYGFDEDLGIESFSKKAFEKRICAYDINVVRKIAFNELKSDDNGHIRRGVIAKRLKEIREVGYPVPSHDNLGQDDLWTFLQDIRSKIRGESVSGKYRVL